VSKVSATAGDELHVVRLLEARYGGATPGTRLTTLFKRNPQLDDLDWSLLVTSIEIDLRVHMSPRLLQTKLWTLGQFARAVAALPKVANQLHTLELLTIVSEQLLATQLPADTAPKRKGKRAGKKTRTVSGKSSTQPPPSGPRWRANRSA
jgi:hypothetical protein